MPTTTETLSQQLTGSVEFVGKSIKFSGNIVTRNLYFYQCLRATTFGPEILAQTFPNGVTYLERMEYLDFFMHHVGFFIIVGILVNHGKDGLHTTMSSLVWGTCLGITLLHYLHVYYIFLFFTLPLRTASKVGLMVPIGEEAISDLQNEFVRVRADETTRYQCTNDQNAVLAIALSRSLQLDFMVYNKAWNFRNVTFAGTMNVFSHLMVVIVMAMSKPQKMVLGAVLTYIIYYILYAIMLNRANECMRGCLSVIFNVSCLCCGCSLCVCMCSTKTEKRILDGLRQGVESGDLPQAKSVKYISWNCFNGNI